MKSDKKGNSMWTEMDQLESGEIWSERQENEKIKVRIHLEI